MNETSSNPLDGMDLNVMMEEIMAMAEGLDRNAQERYTEMLPRLVVIVTGDDQQLPEAIATGRLVIDDYTFALRFNADSGQLEFFCDVGVPASHSREEAYRKSLEFNLCRTIPGIALGVHPTSGRIVATSSLHMLMVSDASVCVQMIDTLKGVVQELRASGELALED
jgi:hypothetical protein